jgi:TRAP-type mannitol/chloroaromatic compound transport system permease small subunit
MYIFQLAIDAIDSFTERCGQLLAWLCLMMALVTGLVVAMRYGLGVGSIALQESITYMHASVFMLGAAFALKHGSHVHVDIFYRNFSERTRAWVNGIGGIIFLLPLCVVILGISWNFVSNSWSVYEVSAEPGGIPAVYLLKTLIPLMAINLFAQAIAEILRNALILVATQPGEQR